MSRSDTSAVAGVLAEVIRSAKRAGSDGSLVQAFVDRRDSEAFEELVRRHGAMVLGVCLRVLRHRQDAEDAFQATFLVLARKARSVSPPDLVGNWLHGVALLTATRARAKSMKRRARETVVATPPDVAVVEAGWDDIAAILDEEMGRLPDHYRAVILLCDVEGRSRKDAGQHLGCPEGSVSSRLSRARAMLARRLTRRGVTLPATTLGLVVMRNAASAAVPLVLRNATVSAALAPVLSTVPPAVASLVDGVIQAMFLTKTKVATVAAMAIGIMGAFALTSLSIAGGQRGAGPGKITAPPAVQPQPPARGDDAKALLGTWIALDVQPRSRIETREELAFLEQGGVRLRFDTKEIWYAVDTEGLVRKLDYRLDPTSDPRRIEWIDGSEIMASGIYELKGDDLKLCMRKQDRSNDPPPKTPKTFDPKSEGVMVMTLKREKPTVPMNPHTRNDVPDPEAAAIKALAGMHADLERDANKSVIGVRLQPQGGRLSEALPHLKALTKLQRLAFHGGEADVEAFINLGALPLLSEIELHAPFADNGPSPVSFLSSGPLLPWEKLPRIRTVRLTGMGIGNAQLQALSKAVGVQDLHLNQIRASRKGLSTLRGIKSLESLLIQSSNVTAADVEALVGIDKLHSLTLASNDLGRDAFPQFARMPGLRYLNLESTRATDDDIAHLGALTRLESLDLGYNREISDAALHSLARNKKLLFLRLYETKVTPEGIAKLKNALPALETQGVPSGQKPSKGEAQHPPGEKSR